MKKTVSVVVLQGTAVISAGADESFKIKNRENGKASRNIFYENSTAEPYIYSLDFGVVGNRPVEHTECEEDMARLFRRGPEHRAEPRVQRSGRRYGQQGWPQRTSYGRTQRTLGQVQFSYRKSDHLAPSLIN